MQCWHSRTWKRWGFGSSDNSTDGGCHDDLCRLFVADVLKRMFQYFEGPSVRPSLLAFRQRLRGIWQRRLCWGWCKRCSYCALHCRRQKQLTLLPWWSGRSLQLSVRLLRPAIGETRQVSRMLIYEDRTEFLQHQIATQYQNFRIETQVQKGVLPAEVIDDKHKSSLELCLGQWNAITSREAVEDGGRRILLLIPSWCVPLLSTFWDPSNPFCSHRYYSAC